MADEQATRKPRGPYRRNRDNGQAGEVASGAGAVGPGAGQGLDGSAVADLTWEELQLLIEAKEREQPDRRVVRVFCPIDDVPALYLGVNGNAPIERAEAPAMQWNTGEIVPL